MPAQTPTQPLDIAASQNPAHPQHNFHLAQIIATLFLGLGEYAAIRQGGAVNTLTNPLNLAQVVSGFSSIWVTQPEPVQQQLPGLVNVNQLQAVLDQTQAQQQPQQ